LQRHANRVVAEVREWSVPDPLKPRTLMEYEGLFKEILRSAFKLITDRIIIQDPAWLMEPKQYLLG
jgi:hypothetical protein